MLIGIAGKTGSGKNFIASRLEKAGWRTLDLDEVAHTVLDTLSGEIRERFGGDAVDADGRVNRKALAGLVFRNPERLEELEALTYPRIEAETRKWIAGDPDCPGAIHAVNLHKTDLQKDLQAIIWVKASLLTRIRRVMHRDKRSWAELKGRFRSQNGLNTKLFSPNAEIYSVRNSGNLRSLDRKLGKILRRL